MPGYEDARERASQRRIQEDRRFDENGIYQPPVSWLERLTDMAYPPEVAQAEDTPAWAHIVGPLLAAPLGIAGAWLDEVSPLDTRDDWQSPGPVINPIRHEAHNNHYDEERAAAEERRRAAENYHLPETNIDDEVCEAPL